MSKVTEEIIRAFLEGASFGGSGARHVAITGIQALLDQKLLVDPRNMDVEAFVQDGIISLPVNEAAIRESVVREAMALFECLPNHHYIGPSIHADLKSLLPTKDRAEELVDAYCSEKLNYTPNSEERRSLLKTFRWLIEREGANG